MFKRTVGLSFSEKKRCKRKRKYLIRIRFVELNYLFKGLSAKQVKHARFQDSFGVLGRHALNHTLGWHLCEPLSANPTPTHKHSFGHAGGGALFL